MMLFEQQPLQREHAQQIVRWQYEAPYEFYNGEDREEDIQELLDGSYVAVFADGKLAGFFCTGKSAQVPKGHLYKAYDGKLVDIGLGMHPTLTGQGGGSAFWDFVLHSVSAEQLRLTVASFNKRAICLYEKFGFVKTMTFEHFEVMERHKKRL